MGLEEITMQVDDEAARAFKSASSMERRKLEALVSVQLLKATRSRQSLKELMTGISRKAVRRGITPEILQAILNDR